MRELSRDSKAIIEAARDLDDPKPADRARMRKAVFAAVTGGAALVSGTAAGTAAASGGAASAGAGGLLIAKVAAVVAVAGVIGGVVVLEPWADTPAPDTAAPSGQSRWAAPVTPRQARVQVVAQVPTPVAEVPAEPVIEAEAAPPLPREGLAPVRTHPATAVVPEPTPAPEPPQLGAELALLRQAHAAQRAGDPGQALLLLDQHARRFPAGILDAERLATRVLVLCDLGRVAEARAGAERFLATRPDSPLSARIRASCAAQ